MSNSGFNDFNSQLYLFNIYGNKFTNSPSFNNDLKIESSGCHINLETKGTGKKVKINSETEFEEDVLFKKDITVQGNFINDAAINFTAGNLTNTEINNSLFQNGNILNTDIGISGTIINRGLGYFTSLNISGSSSSEFYNNLNICGGYDLIIGDSSFWIKK